MKLFKFVSATVVRALFVLVALIGVVRVTIVKNDSNYWWLTLLFLPLVLELILTMTKHKGKDYKWFSPPILLFLISIIPSIWILELDHQEHKKDQSECNTSSTMENLQILTGSNSTNETSNFLVNLHSAMKTVCSDDWILALHQVMLLLLIVGKWLLPRGGGVTREGLSELLLIFVGTAADILEFTNETLSDLEDTSPELVGLIYGIWTWSMLQFPLHFSVVHKKASTEEETQHAEGSLLVEHSSDLFNIMEAVLLQDGPFLMVRLTVMFFYDTVHQMLVFFALKNCLVILLNFYRLFVIYRDYKHLHRSWRMKRTGDEVMIDIPEEMVDVPSGAFDTASVMQDAPRQKVELPRYRAIPPRDSGTAPADEQAIPGEKRTAALDIGAVPGEKVPGPSEKKKSSVEKGPVPSEKKKATGEKKQGSAEKTRASGEKTETSKNQSAAKKQ